MRTALGRPNHVGHRFDCYDPTNNWFISAFGHLFMEKSSNEFWAIWGIGNLIVVSGIGQVMKWLIQRPRPVLEAGMVRDSHKLSQWPYPASCYTGDYLFAFHSIFV